MKPVVGRDLGLPPWTRSAAALALLTLAALTAPAIVRLDPTISGPFERHELLAWAALVLGALAIPNLRLWASGRFHVAHPLVHVSWTYFLPFFVMGTVIYAAGGTTHISLSRVPHAPLNFRLALFYVILALLALALGVGADAARRLGGAVARRLPEEGWRPIDILVAGLVLTVLGGAFSVATFLAGITGFQLEGNPEPYAATVYYLSLMFQIGQLLVWFAVFSTPRRSWPFLASAVALVLGLPFWVVLAGSRGMLFSTWLLVVLAFFLSGRKPSLGNVAFLSLVGALTIAIGTLYGTTFRQIKGHSPLPSSTVTVTPTPPEATAPPPRAKKPRPSPPPAGLDDMMREAQRRVTMGEQFALAGETVETIRSGQATPRAWSALAARLDAVTSLAVLVANRESLADRSPPSLRRSILIGLATALVPRLLWPGKPVIGDVRAYGLLYFDLPSNSFAVTPFGDLLLNFGPGAVPVGMALLGFLMRVLYSAFVETHPRMGGRSVVYAICLVNVSFEGFYATIVPSLIRVLVVALVAVGTALFVTRALSRRRLPGPGGG